MTLVETRVDKANEEVSSSLLGLGVRRAVHRSGLGCTVVRVDEEPVHLGAPALRAGARQGAYPEDIAATGNDTSASGVYQVLGNMGFDGPRQTRAIVVLKDGQIVAERYGPGFSAERVLPGWSMTKTITAALVGILVGQGRLAIGQPAPVSTWRSPGDERGQITIEHLLHMTSGLVFSEDAGDPLSDLLVMLYHERDTAAFAASKPLQHPPGHVWRYSSGTSNILSAIIRNNFGGDTSSYVRFPREALFNPAQMMSAVFEPDAAGTFVGSSYVYATARDWARFGQLLLQDGVWDGRRILPEGWVRYMATPSWSAAPQGGYGAHVWLNRGQAEEDSDLRWPDLPRDSIVALGHGGQILAVFPGRRIVVVRLGQTRGWDYGGDTNKLLAEILRVLEE